MKHKPTPPGKTPGFDFTFTALADGRVEIVVQHLSDDGSYIEARSTAAAASRDGLRALAAKILKSCDDAETAERALVAALSTRAQEEAP